MAEPRAGSGVVPTRSSRRRDAEALRRIDAALIGLRHLWAAAPPRHPAGEGMVELSTVWIVDAMSRAEAAGNRERSVRDLAGALDVAHSTASRLIERAEAAGMVTRTRSATDARQASIALTPAGRTLASTSLAFRTDYLAGLTTSWTANERATFADLLTRIALAAAQRPPAHAAEPDPRR